MEGLLKDAKQYRNPKSIRVIRIEMEKGIGHIKTFSRGILTGIYLPDEKYSYLGICIFRSMGI